MQLVIKGGEVVADYPSDATVPLAQFPGGRLVPYAGTLAALERVGAPPESGPDTRPYKAPVIDLAAYAAFVRWRTETGGLTVAGARVATDEGSQAKIGNAYALQQATGATEVDFKTESGWVKLPAAQLKALAIAVGQHVQACYSKEAEIDAAITAGTILDLDGVDAAFAPLAA